MKIDTTLLATELSQMSRLTQAAEHSDRISSGTSIAVAFPRSQATLAYIAWDLAKYSKGRFLLGLGPQTNNHFQ